MEDKGRVPGKKEWMEHHIKNWIKRRKESLNIILFTLVTNGTRIPVNYLAPETSEDIQMDSFEQEKEELNHEEIKVGGTLNINQH
jgi:hypothetical protein